MSKGRNKHNEEEEEEEEDFRTVTVCGSRQVLRVYLDSWRCDKMTKQKDKRREKISVATEVRHRTHYLSTESSKFYFMNSFSHLVSGLTVLSMNSVLYVFGFWFWFGCVCIESSSPRICNVNTVSQIDRLEERRARCHDNLERAEFRSRKEMLSDRERWWKCTLWLVK